ncbi:hypothetical protein ACFL1N_15965 [Thermodesulfobacteriota bacterium]
MDIDLKLPMPADQLVPHRPPFLFVTNLLEFSGEVGVVESILAPDNLFLNEDNSLRELAMVEILAQSAAAVKGFSSLQKSEDIKKGFLVEIREFLYKKECYSDDIIHSHIAITKSFSGFSIIKGILKRRGEELASGSLKLWVPEDA